MDVEIPVLAGYLSVPTQTGFSLNRISKKKTCSRYCLLFKASRHGIARLEIGESKDDKNPKIFTLENCVKITQEPPPASLIQIVKRNGTLTLNPATDDEQRDWVTALQTVAFCDKSGSHSHTHGAIEEDNDLYCSSFDGQFMITLIPSEASIRCSIEPKTYLLHMTSTELQLKSAEDQGVTIAMWPYRFIRKYGYRDGKFTFEAGRKCTTGEGVFTLDHTTPQEVFRCMSAKMKSMKKLISGNNNNSTGNDSALDCGDNQFNAAACMEAGSRSPLPPSPSSNHQHSGVGSGSGSGGGGGEFEINSTQSCISLRGFISSNDSLNNFSSASGPPPLPMLSHALPLPLPLPPHGMQLSLPLPPPPVKHIPNKPPRKLPTPLEKPSGSPSANPTNTIGSGSGNSSTTVNASSGGGGGSSGGCAAVQIHCDKFKNIVKYEPVAITTSNDGGGGGGVNSCDGTIVLLRPDLPLRNESAKQQQQQQHPMQLQERDYECIENITDAWKTRGVGDVRHCERMPPSPIAPPPPLPSICDTEFVRQRSQKRKELPSPISTSVASGAAIAITPTTPKIIDIDIGEAITPGTDPAYDRLDFLSPNNKTSSGYKTIVNVTSPANRVRCSPPPPNEYELIASPDTEPFRKADDSHLGYGVLRKATTPTAQAPPLPLPPTSSSSSSLSATATVIATATVTANASSSSSAAPSSTISTTTPTTPTMASKSNDMSLDHRSYNGLNYTIVSKPKRV